MTNIARWAIFLISSKLIEALKLLQTKQDDGFILSMHIINIPMDPLI
jgi:hypothetical protein